MPNQSLRVVCPGAIFLSRAPFFVCKGDLSGPLELENRTHNRTNKKPNSTKTYNFFPSQQNFDTQIGPKHNTHTPYTSLCELSYPTRSRGHPSRAATRRYGTAGSE